MLDQILAQFWRYFGSICKARASILPCQRFRLILRICPSPLNPACVKQWASDSAPAQNLAFHICFHNFLVYKPPPRPQLATSSTNGLILDKRQTARETITSSDSKTSSPSARSKFAATFQRRDGMKSLVCNVLSTWLHMKDRTLTRYSLQDIPRTTHLTSTACNNNTSREFHVKFLK